MRKLQQVGVTGMLVVTLAAGSGGAASAAGSGRASRANIPMSNFSTTVHTESAYQRQLSTLAKIVGTDNRQIELAITRVANGLPLD